MIAKIKLFLGLIHLASSSITLTRSTYSETITCNQNMDCNEYQSLQKAPFVCECGHGTFFYSQNQMKCYKGSGLFASKYKVLIIVSNSERLSFISIIDIQEQSPRCVLQVNFSEKFAELKGKLLYFESFFDNGAGCGPVVRN